MHILKDNDIEFVVNDYLKGHSEDIRNKVIDEIKQDRERFGFPGNGNILRSRLENIVGSAVNFAVLSQKLYFKREIEEFIDADIRFYEWSFGNTNYCHNGHSQMDKKIFCIDDAEHYYVRKPQKILVQRERPSKMPKGSPYDANEICNCTMLPFLTNLEGYTITDTEPEPTTKVIKLQKQKPVRNIVPESISFNNIYQKEKLQPSNSNSIITGIIFFVIAFIVIVIFCL